MKKLDKLIIGSFIGPFILTFLVVVFILLTQHMLKYFDDIIGKDLGWDVVGQLLFYFAVFMTPVAMPLAVLLSALIAFGNLGEHFELTAIKAAGISLIRALRPIFFFVLILTGFAFYVNNTLVPKAALEAYSLLYDIKQKKPALELKEGTFYNGIPDISIKVNKKFKDDEAALKEIIVYDHRKNEGNKEVTVADSGRMYTILNERYLKFELFNGYNYTEGANQEREMTGQQNSNGETLTRSKFSKTQVVFDLSSFQLARTDKKWFQGNRIMRNLGELDHDIDSIKRDVMQQRLNHYQYGKTFFTYLYKGEPVEMPEDVRAYKAWRDSINELRIKKRDTTAASQAKPAPKIKAGLRKLTPFTPGDDKWVEDNKLASQDTSKAVISSNRMLTKADTILNAKLDSIVNAAPTKDMVEAATNAARHGKTDLMNNNASVDNYNKELRIFEIQWHKILASSLACIAMFLIGAPLGAIIKKGGLGVPFLVSILFFIVYYVLTMQGEKLAKQDTISAMVGVWAADAILFVVGLIFLRQARVDARLFDSDFYNIALDKLKQWYASKRVKSLKTAS